MKNIRYEKYFYYEVKKNVCNSIPYNHIFPSQKKKIKLEDAVLYFRSPSFKHQDLVHLNLNQYKLLAKETRLESLEISFEHLSLFVEIFIFFDRVFPNTALGKRI